MDSKKNFLPFLLLSCFFALIACEEYDDEFDNDDEDVYSSAGGPNLDKMDVISEGGGGGGYYEIVPSGKSDDTALIQTALNRLQNGATMRDNFIQGAFYDNRMDGVLFRNKTDDGIMKNNKVDILVFGNQGLRNDGTPSSIGGGLSVDGSPITGITGTVVAYQNGSAHGGYDIVLGSGTNSSIKVYNPSDRNPARVKKGNSTNVVNEVRYVFPIT